MGSCAVKSKVVDSSSAGGSSAFESNIVVSPSAPPAESPSSGGNATWAIAYANESNGVVQQAYGKLRSDFVYLKRFFLAMETKSFYLKS